MIILNMCTTQRKEEGKKLIPQLKKYYKASRTRTQYDISKNVESGAKSREGGKIIKILQPGFGFWN